MRTAACCTLPTHCTNNEIKQNMSMLLPLCALLLLIYVAVIVCKCCVCVGHWMWCCSSKCHHHCGINVAVTVCSAPICCCHCVYLATICSNVKCYISCSLWLKSIIGESDIIIIYLTAALDNDLNGCRLYWQTAQERM